MGSRASGQFSFGHRPPTSAAMVEGLNPRIGFAIAAGAIGSSFQHGYNTGVLNAPEVMIKQWTKSYVCPDAANETLEILPGDEHSVNNACNVSVTFIWSFVVSIFCIGGMMGGSVVGVVSSRLGRKGGLLLNNILVVISAILMGAAKAAGSYHMLILGRLIIGINAGLNAGLAPMYLAEISPTSLRGALTTTLFPLIIIVIVIVILTNWQTHSDLCFDA